MSSEDEGHPHGKNYNYNHQSEEAGDYEGSERAQDEYEGDENDGEQDEEEYDAEAPEQEVEEENNNDDPEDEDEEGEEGRPATQGAPKDELLQAGAIFLRQLFASQTNAKGGHQGTPLSHQDVEHHISDEHVCIPSR